MSDVSVCSDDVYLFVAYTDLKQLSHEAREKQYPDSPLLKSLNKAVKEGDKYSCLGMFDIIPG